MENGEAERSKKLSWGGSGSEGGGLACRAGGAGGEI